MTPPPANASPSTTSSSTKTTNLTNSYPHDLQRSRPLRRRAFILLVMKKLIAAALLLFAPTVFAADPEIVISSAQPLIGALESLPGMDSMTVVANYLPGYGLQLSSAGFQDEATAALDIAWSIQGIVEGLAGTVQGLESGDWVSAGLSYDSAFPIHIVARVKPGQPETSEIWITGEKIP